MQLLQVNILHVYLLKSATSSSTYGRLDKTLFEL